MELFSEIYNLYYRAVENVLRQAQEKPLSGKELQQILELGTFSESAIAMLPKLQDGDWPLLHQTESGYAANCAPLQDNPLTTLQQAWLKALLDDPRMCLFLDENEISALREAFSSVTPLYSQTDFYLFDKSSDGDTYERPSYRYAFRLFLAAVRNKTELRVQYEGGKGKRITGVFRPYRLEYSSKDDKFRAHCYKLSDRRMIPYILNLGRVAAAETLYENEPEPNKSTPQPAKAPMRQVTIAITTERNALERCMVHFAHFEKRTEYDETNGRYVCTIRYHAMDETEVVIRVLSFGPTIQVLSPVSFVDEIRNRVKKQTDYLRKMT